MHPAPSLVEAPPKTNGEDDRSGQRPSSAGSARQDRQDLQDLHSPTDSHPVRKDTSSSNSTVTTSGSGATITSDETTRTSYSIKSASPTFTSLAVFSVVKDGTDLSNSRRTTRRRTGPLSPAQRERAALIRKVGACTDCRRRRVACHPSHHNMTWEDAMRKYKSHSPTMELDLAPLAGRPLSPAPVSGGRPGFKYANDPHEMDIDKAPTPLQPPGRPTLIETRLRTPLPSGRGPEKFGSGPLPPIDNGKADLQGLASRIVTNPYRSRYAAVSVLLLHWEDDSDGDVRGAMEELASVLRDEYHYTFDTYPIPTAPGECKTPFRALARRVGALVDDHDQRDVLKVVYYNGHTYLDGDREMVLANSPDKAAAKTIRWSGIQQMLESAVSDTLILMDAAYYPSSKMVRDHGVLELVAASAAEDHLRFLGRSSFTRALTELLRTRASQSAFRSPFSAAELHAKLLSRYPDMMGDREPGRERVTSFPSPLHLQIAGDARLPSVLLAPARWAPPPLSPEGGSPTLNLTLRLANEAALGSEAWTEWLRAMPAGVRDIKVEGPTFR